jgi:hypothetical protein
MLSKRHQLKRVLCIAFNPRRKEARRMWVTHENLSHIDAIPNLGIIRIVDGIDETIKQCLDPYAPLVPGEEQCTYCRGFAMCPAVNSEFRDLEVVPMMPTSEVVPTMLGELAKRVALGTKWVKEAKAYLWDVARAGTKIPGYEMREINGSRSIEDAILAYQRLSSHLSLHEFLACMRPSITKMEEAYVAEGKIREPDRTAPDLEAEFNMVLGNAIKREPSNWRLVKAKESDDV